MQVAIASTDFDPNQAEIATIVSASGGSLTLDKPLQYGRFAPSAPTGGGGYIPMVRPPAVSEMLAAGLSWPS